MSIKREVNINGRQITFEFDKFAKQANGSVMVSSGGTQVLVTACASESKSSADFFPLSVDYIEKFYAAGRIPGGYNKREGRPSESATLTARVIDRPLRPSFPKGYQNETVITATVMSYEHGHSPAPLALVGASTALMISDIPFNGPVAALKIGLKDDQYVIDPIEGEEDSYDLDLNIACKPDAVLMVEAGAKCISEEKMLEAINFAHKAMTPFFDMQKEIQEKIGKPKWTVSGASHTKETVDNIRQFTHDAFIDIYSTTKKHSRQRKLADLAKKVSDTFNPDANAEIEKEVQDIFDNLKSNFVRSKILSDKTRIDGRTLTQIRPISCEINTLKNPHGSALFTRGETQALASVTLASELDKQRTESLWDTDIKERFMLHYNFPPFCVGEARMQRPPGRREIGHGTLARRALLSVLPEETDFSYTIRVVSETLESNGSSSMATVCAGTMALLNAGVPLSAPVAGIAMGLMKQGDDYAILSDILGDEDHLGDMDFKVCGTKAGITALQMDIKISGLTKDILKKALDQAKEGRLHILEKMSEAIVEPEKLSGLAPRLFKVKIPTDKIRDIIGPGGKNIKKITEEAGVKIEVEETGIINISAPDMTSAQAAKSLIRAYTSYPKIGEVYLGTVVRLVDFGSFVEIKAGVEGMCHISQLDENKGFL